MANGIDSFVIDHPQLGVYNLDKAMTALPAGRRLFETVRTASGHVLMLLKAGATITDGALFKISDASDGTVIETAAAYDTVLGFNPKKGASVTTAAPYFWGVVGPVGATVADVKSASSVAENAVVVAGATGGTGDVVGLLGTAAASAFTAALGMVLTPNAETAGGLLQGRIIHAAV